MKFTPSKDGKLRASVSLIVRITASEADAIRVYLVKKGQESNDRAVRDFVRQNSDTDFSYIYERSEGSGE